MEIASGTVIEGKVVVEGRAIPDGTRVTVLVPEQESTFSLTAEQKADLRAAMAQGERGEVITPAELYERLDRV